MNDRCIFMDDHGECDCLTETYCIKEPDKKCAFHKSKNEYKSNGEPKKAPIRTSSAFAYR